MKNINSATCIDGYKMDHRRQYDPRVSGVLANFTPRGSRIEEVDKVTFFGLQYFLKKYMQWDDFFSMSVDQAAEKYTRRINSYLGPNNIGDSHIRALHKLGYLPLVFNALPEGTAVPLRVPMFTIQETIPEFFWLVNYIESIMSATIWGPCTSATQAREMRKVLNTAANLTGTPLGFVDWQGHDFSFRGMFGLEAACMSGAGHLLYFTGTDTVPALDWIQEYYGEGLPENYLLGGSVAATEHSVMCAGGESGELETYSRLLDLYPSGIVSVVSDTWDLWNVVTNILPQLKDKIVSRDGKLVIRPDSGDPVKIICGDSDAPADSPARAGLIELLWNIFGGTINSMGFKELDSHIGAIYGDSITRARAFEICDKLALKGFASGNIVFGIGSYTYQYVTRDTFMFAGKSTWVRFDGVGRPIFKAPKTDNGTKNSAKGRIAVFKDEKNELYLIENATQEQERESLLREVWRNGSFSYNGYKNFKQVRELAQLEI